ncbi:hypothetical protein F8388_012176 [Cannabis sativa]|uniref:Uncharacterized protein n=1 Tax=Cannabis sativa TaxID=3483 RepID=A0A7J6E228_CANSA|nr:hypothetical protein F8388_012176 [Cannabis sativa]
MTGLQPYTILVKHMRTRHLNNHSAAHLNLIIIIIIIIITRITQRRHHLLETYVLGKRNHRIVVTTVDEAVDIKEYVAKVDMKGYEFIIRRHYWPPLLLLLLLSNGVSSTVINPTIGNDFSTLRVSKPQLLKTESTFASLWDINLRDAGKISSYGAMVRMKKVQVFQCWSLKMSCPKVVDKTPIKTLLKRIDSIMVRMLRLIHREASNRKRRVAVGLGELEAELAGIPKGKPAVTGV